MNFPTVFGKSIAGWWFFANPSEKYWDDEIPIYIYMWKVIKFHGSKPPTRLGM
jgi:hypothetical protein